VNKATKKAKENSSEQVIAKELRTIQVCTSAGEYYSEATVVGIVKDTDKTVVLRHEHFVLILKAIKTGYTKSLSSMIRDFASNLRTMAMDTPTIDEYINQLEKEIDEIAFVKDCDVVLALSQQEPKIIDDKTVSETQHEQV